MAGPSACRLCGRDIEPRGHPAYCKRCTAKAGREVARMPRVDCKECGKAFATKTRSVHYCSDACRISAARRANVEYQRRYEADPEKLALKMARARAYDAARRARARGEEPPQAGRDVGRLKRNAAPVEPYPCRLCGRDFAPYGGARPAYCKRCRARFDKEINRVMAVDCRECGQKFSTLNRIAVYCSKACRAAGRKRTTDESSRRGMADPEKHVLRVARIRARSAAHRAEEKGRGGQRNA